MLKAVLDTNVFISGMFWKGDCEKILRMWFNDKFILISSLEIIQELIDVLLNFKIRMNIDDIIWWRDLILEKAMLVFPKIKIDIVKEDKEDNKFIEAAIEGKADFIVTQDKHLLKIKEYNGVKIIHPKEFLKILKK